MDIISALAEEKEVERASSGLFRMEGVRERGGGQKRTACVLDIVETIITCLYLCYA